MEYIRKKYYKLCCAWDLSKCCTCCDMDKIWMCGRSLKKQLSIVAIGSIAISTITFLISMTWLIHMSDRDDVLYNNEPITAAHLIISLVVSLMSVYQFTISVMLLRQTMATEDDVFYYVIWYVSHLSILSLYWAFFILELVLCLTRHQYGTAAAAGAVAGLYQGVFSYFTVVVNAALYAVP